MNTKRLITASIFSLISASTALAADVLIPHQPASSTSSAIVAPTFSWTGLYLGVQAGGFSSKADMALIDQEKNFSLDKEFSPKLSGFAGGFYAGSNIDLGDSFVFGIDTDLMLSGKKHTKTITIGASNNATVENAVGRARRSAEVVTPKASISTVSVPSALNVQTKAEGGIQQSKGLTETNANPKAPENSTTQTLLESEKTVQSPAAGSTNSVKSVSGRSSPTAMLKQTARSKQTSSTTGTNSEQPVSPSLLRSDTGETSLRENVSKVVAKSASPSVQTGSISKASEPLSLARSSTGEQPSEARVSEPKASVKSESAQTVEKTPVSSHSIKESNESVAKAPTSVQPSAVEKTVPGSSLVLARSGSSGSEKEASNGTSGGHHSIQSYIGNNSHSRVASNGGGHAHPHGAPHGGGYGSGANPHGSHPHTSHPHGGQNMAGHGAQSPQAADKSNSSVYGIEQIKKVASELALDQEDEVEALNHTFKQNWGGATRVRIGFAADRFMPYLAGGIAYGQFQDTVSISVKGEDGSVVSSKNLTDETKTMIGYTLGGGIDFAMLDNVIVRAEYRYSDFGKKKFAKEKLEVNYKTNDFRVGVAYKF
ncbi:MULTISPECIES: outer membrane beta-barrel protein [unclassified Bartonella]|uniref:outer membrane beta-barrel protein n=1 Tax=unclassified Bartonella TaxID=2645622 RepID=UPI0035D04D75